MHHLDRQILTLSCRDVRGIVAAVTNFLANNQGFILESAQFGDEDTGHFFMRVDFAMESGLITKEILREKFATEIAERFSMQWNIVDKHAKDRVLIMVSQFGHCLNDLLYRYSNGQLNIEIPAIVSNHNDWEKVAKWHNIPFYYLPITKDTKPQQEEKLRDLIAEHDVDSIVLARYMQILSPEICAECEGQIINIHHSFLPSFKGAKPYMQAFERGVKIIGATAHYVTSDLDEGPIIEQEVARVDHTDTAEELAAIGRDIECTVLARALKYHSEHRVFPNGRKTVVFK